MDSPKVEAQLKDRLKYFLHNKRQVIIINAVRGIPKIIPKIPPNAVPQKKIETITTTGCNPVC